MYECGTVYTQIAAEPPCKVYQNCIPSLDARIRLRLRDDCHTALGTHLESRAALKLGCQVESEGPETEEGQSPVQAETETCNPDWCTLREILKLTSLLVTFVKSASLFP
jgi:hypothetical protein